MNCWLKIMCASIALMGAPAIAQPDQHAGHHPAGDAVVPAAPVVPTSEMSKPHCPMMSTQAHAKEAQHQGAKPKQGEDMMGTGMSKRMMKCMDGHAAAIPKNKPGK